MFAPREKIEYPGICGSPDTLRFQVSGEIPKDGFELEIRENHIVIRSSNLRGRFYAEQLLESMHRSSRILACQKLVDYPDIEVRGYMLDISRNKVPTRSQILHMIELLADMRYNQLQLYTEHTYAYRDHGVVWGDSSPLTADDLKVILEKCQLFHIELVPNQNSLGHMERWLKHAEYEGLAECPHGFTHPVNGELIPKGSTLCPNDKSLWFMEKLYDELFPNFSSDYINVGCDEPWELGEGRSKELFPHEEKVSLYIKYLKKLCGVVRSRGKKMMFWADVLLEDGRDVAPPEGSLPIIWNYDADAPFDVHAKCVAGHGCDFYLAPGDNTWTSFSGRFHVARANVRRACESATKFGAKGVLMTHWGDHGHHQTWIVQVPALCHAGICMWNLESDDDDTLRAAIQWACPNRDVQFCDALLNLVSAEALLGEYRSNRSLLFDIVYHESSFVRHDVKGLVQSECVNAYIRRVESVYEILKCDEECELTMKMALDAAKRALNLYEGRSLGKIAYLDEFEQVWLKRNRIGGLESTLEMLRGVDASG